MSKLTADQISAEMDQFEAIFPIPSHTRRIGDSYAVSSFNAWDGHKYCDMWEGWKARAEIALPILEQQERGEGWIEWGGGEPPMTGYRTVDVKFRDGKEFMGEQMGCLCWEHQNNSPADIIAYRIIPEQPTNQSGEQ